MLAACIKCGILSWNLWMSIVPDCWVVEFHEFFVGVLTFELTTSYCITLALHLEKSFFFCFLAPFPHQTRACIQGVFLKKFILNNLRVFHPQKLNFSQIFNRKKNSDSFTIFLSENPQNLWENNQCMCPLNLEQSFFTSILGFILWRNKHVSLSGIRILVKLNIFHQAACLKHLAYIPGNL